MRTSVTGARETALRPPAVPAARVRPVVGWAALGVAFLAVEFWAVAGWIVSGDATPTPRGPTPVPPAMLVAIRSIEVACSVGLVVVLWVFLVRPRVRTGRITQDGWLCLIFLTLAWQDSLLNWFQPWFAYNTALFNFGSWNSHVPGWFSPNGNLLAAPLAFYGGYGSVIFAGVVLGNAVVRRVAARRPGLGPVGVMAVTFGFFAVFCSFEMIFLAAGMYSYPGAIKGLTLFPGHRYQYPLYEWLALTTLMTGWAGLRWFRDDRGYTVAERGLDQVVTTARKRTALRVLALAGATNLIFVVCYNVPLAVSGLYADRWPSDVTSRSYLTSRLCGEGTDYACPGDGVPIARRGGTHFRPDGTVAPPG